MRASSNGVLFSLLLVVGFASPAGAEEYVKSYPITGRASVRVNADNAGVHITASDARTVDFDVKYENWGNDAPKIDSHQEGNTTELSVRTASHAWWRWPTVGQHLSIEVRMPKTGDLHVETSNGGVDVSSVNGSVVVRTSNGGIRAEQITGQIDVGSTNGGITLNALKGAVKAGTTNGAIRAGEIDGQCELSTTNGSVHVTGRLDALRVSSGNGSVVAEAGAGSTVASDWSIRTTNSSINLAIPHDLKAHFDASAWNGHVTMDLPGEPSRRESEISTALNGGGHEVSVRTTNGAIHLRGI
jgi:DUF4097 and DUF4098 domain-containing protein YvlB